MNRICQKTGLSLIEGPLWSGILGSYPLGIRFPSKHGSAGAGHGHCYAFWMRRRDVGLEDDPVHLSHAQDIAVNLPAYQTALKMHGIQSR